MKHLFYLATFIVALLIFSSCAVKKPSVDNQQQEIISSKTSLNKYDSLPYQPTITKHWELDSTEIDIHFNFEKRTAKATARLQLSPYFYPSNEIILDAKGMDIHFVVTDYYYYYDHQRFNRIHDTIDFEYDGRFLKIPLQQKKFVNEGVTLTISYTAQPYQTQSSEGKAIRSDKGLYFVNTDGYEPYQPLQVWTQGEPESNSRWFPTFDHTNFRSTFKISMTVPDSLKTLSNGELISSKKSDNGIRTDTWFQKIPIPPYLVMMAVGDFAVVDDRSIQNIPIQYFVPKDYEPYAKDIFQHTPEMIEFFSKTLKTDYPWNKYAQIITYDFVSGAMENVSASLFGAFNLKDKRRIADDPNDFIVAHELFHQWFGNLVTAKSWTQLTMNESFADFGEKLWTEYKYGYDDKQIRFYHSKLRYLAQTPQSDFPLVRHRYISPDNVFDRVSYSKGGLILNYLRMLSGDSAFFQSLHTYLNDNKLQSAEAEQLRLAFEKTTGMDWNWFFEQWYRKGGHPVIVVDYEYDDVAQELRVNTKQTQKAASYQTEIYQLPLKAQLIYNHHLETIDWYVDSLENTFVFPYRNGIKPIFIPDAGHWLPGVIKENKTAEQWERQYLISFNNIESETDIAQNFSGFPIINKLDVMTRHKALWSLLELKLHNASLQTDGIFKIAIEKDPSAFIRLTAVNLLINSGFKGTENNNDFFYRMAQKETDHKTLSAIIFWLGLQKENKYKDFFESKTDDESYYVAKEALKALNELNHHRAESLARDLMEKNKWSADWLAVALEIIGQNGDPKDFSLFEEMIWQKYEGERNKLLPSFLNYLSVLNDKNSYNKGLQLIQRLAQKNPKDQRYMMPFLTHLKKLSALMERKANATQDDTIKNLFTFKSKAAQDTISVLIKDFDEAQKKAILEELEKK